MKKTLYLLLLLSLGFFLFSCGTNQSSGVINQTSGTFFTPYPPMPDQPAALSGQKSEVRGQDTLTLSSGWSTISFPAESVISTGTFPYALQWWDGSRYQTVYPSSGLSSELCQKGYYAMADRSTPIIINSSDEAGANSATLQSGWNLIAFPFRAAKNFSDLTVTFNGETKALAEVSSLSSQAGSQWLYGIIQYYKNNRWNQLKSDNGANQLQPWKGYWVFCWQPGVALNFASLQASYWAKTYGSPGYDNAYDILPTSDGGAILVGDMNDVNYTWTNHYGWLIKVNAAGSIDWQKSYGGDAYEVPTQLLPTPDGGYIIVGIFYPFIEEGNDFCDMWVVKLDSNAEIVWQKTYGGDAWDLGVSIRLLSDGYLVLGERLVENTSDDSCWLMRLDLSGNVVWQRDFKADSFLVPAGLELTFDNCAMIAATYAVGDYDDLALLKVGLNGNLLWSKHYGGDLEEAWTAVKAVSGGYLLSGFTTSFNNGNYNTWILKLDPAGNILRQTIYGGNDFSSCATTVAAPDGSCLLVGIINQGASDEIWLAGLAADGSISWQKKYGSPGDDWPVAAKAGINGGYWIDCTTYGFGAGRYDYWALRIPDGGSLAPLSVDTLTVPQDTDAVAQDLNVNNVSETLNVGSSAAVTGETNAIVQQQAP